MAERAGVWGAAVDNALATRLGHQVGDRLQVGNLGLGARYLLGQMRLEPAVLLRGGA